MAQTRSRSHGSFTRDYNRKCKAEKCTGCEVTCPVGEQPAGAVLSSRRTSSRPSTGSARTATQPVHMKLRGLGEEAGAGAGTGEEEEEEG